MFQSSSGRRTGCNLATAILDDAFQVVSILIRSPDRMQHPIREASPADPQRFNPHPVAGPDATIRPGPPPQHIHVSILIRSPDRMQHYAFQLPVGFVMVFQSSSGRRTGCNPDWMEGHIVIPRFQSSSGRRTGCNVRGPVAVGGEVIVFQSSSGRRTGCNPDWMEGHIVIPRFQSSSGRRTGCNPEDGKTMCRPHLFQSSSGRRTGCNQGWDRFYSPLTQVSILIRSPDRMQPIRPPRQWLSPECFNPHPVAGPDATSTPRASTIFPLLVSILIRSPDRMQPGDHRRHAGQRSGRFNPHPVAGPDATIR